MPTEVLKLKKTTPTTTVQGAVNCNHLVEHKLAPVSCLDCYRRRGFHWLLNLFYVAITLVLNHALKFGKWSRVTEL